MVYRLFVERREGFKVEEAALSADLRENLGVSGLTAVRIANRYDVEGISKADLDAARYTIFSEPQSDIVSDSFDAGAGAADGAKARLFAIEFLPGQFDQRADSCAQCVQLMTGGERPMVHTAKVYALYGDIDDKTFGKIKKYLINPVESREASFDLPETLRDEPVTPPDVEIIEGFTALSDNSELVDFIDSWSLAMDRDDLRFCVAYFRDEEKRDPTVTELRMIDTYWSDHCRHTTFLTAIDGVKIEDSFIREAYETYLAARAEYYGSRHKDISLMDIATIGAKYMRMTGRLDDLDSSKEVNACSVKITVDVDGKPEDWLLMFKNETHNHPTEIEPFGGAATCLGGAIRDPMSGRSYVYQAMRVTGAADPRLPVSETMPGKLPQSKLTKTAAAGYSSYGNQFGIPAGGIYEIYHPGYVAKRMELGAVVGAAPASYVVREEPMPGDVVILLGGRTGRDGCGGATGSSKAHTAESLYTCGAEVQKGNPPEERKIQRLFRDPRVTRMIKRCNDFGAGGVSVAIGELADGLSIDLSRVPKKYEGLDGTELAISESQERMAVVIAAEDEARFIEYAAAENLEATAVAVVTETPRLVMRWRGKVIVNICRTFLNSNGAPKHTDVEVTPADVRGVNALFDGAAFIDIPADEVPSISATEAAFRKLAGDLNVCSQKGLIEHFDSTVGAATVVVPLGGKNQLTPAEYMAAKLPVLGKTDTASVMAYGFDPYISSLSPYHGAYWAVISSAAKLTAAGCDYRAARASLQEYFERNRGNPARWGKPFAALLGALTAQFELSIPAIGGKDSMSGSFEDIDVPPTLVSFVITTNSASKLVTPEFKSAGSGVWLLSPKYTGEGLVDFDSLRGLFEYIHTLATGSCLRSCSAVGFGGTAERLLKSALGNGIGFSACRPLSSRQLFGRLLGSFVVETAPGCELKPVNSGSATLIGETTDERSIAVNGASLCLDCLEEIWQEPLEKIFPASTPQVAIRNYEAYSCTDRGRVHSAGSFAKPRIVIPVFPGTNCEYDTMLRFNRAGGDSRIFVLRNLTPAALAESMEELAKLIDEAQILMLPGGFSGGDEPDGSAKFITAVLRNTRVRHAVDRLIGQRDGLALGICNGFQALVKSGLLPGGSITDRCAPDSATIACNTIGRHQSKMITTRVASVKSPWFAGVSVGDLHTMPISHGEGRFTAPEALLAALAANGQIATQYVDAEGLPTSDVRCNPNNSALAIEGIFSADGRIFGKMGHSERVADGEALVVNIPGNKDQLIFESGVKYFR